MQISELKINQLIEITAMDASEEMKFLPSRIEEIDEDYLYISPPMLRGEILPLRVGEQLRINFALEDQYYQFNTAVIGRINNPIPLLIVLKPDKIKQIQRRQWVRLPVRLPICFQSEQPDAPVYKGETIDISGGGALFKSDRAFERGQMLNIVLELPDREPVCCKSTVLRVVKEYKAKEEYCKIVVEYDDINDGQRDRIMNYIFEKQREWIRRGLL